MTAKRPSIHLNDYLPERDATRARHRLNHGPDYEMATDAFWNDLAARYGAATPPDLLNRVNIATGNLDYPPDTAAWLALWDEIVALHDGGAPEAAILLGHQLAVFRTRLVFPGKQMAALLPTLKRYGVVER